MWQSWDSGGDSSETHRVTQADSPPSDVLAVLERDLIDRPRQTQVDSSLQGSTAFDLTVDDSDNVGEDCDTVPASNLALREAGRQVDVHGFLGVQVGVRSPSSMPVVEQNRFSPLQDTEIDAQEADLIPIAESTVPASFGAVRRLVLVGVKSHGGHAALAASVEDPPDSPQRNEPATQAHDLESSSESDTESLGRDGLSQVAPELLHEPGDGDIHEEGIVQDHLIGEMRINPAFRRGLESMDHVNLRVIVSLRLLL